MTSTTTPASRRLTTSRRCKPSIWDADMYRASSVLFVTVLALAGSATAGPVMPFAQDRDVRAADRPVQPHDGGLILVQRGGGGGRYAGGANRGGFNSNDFHQNLSNTRNLNGGANRNVNINQNVYANR